MGNSEIIFSKNTTTKTLLRFAVPAIITLLVMELYNMIDTVFAGRYIGAAAIAALTIVFPIQKLLTSAGLLIAVGSSTYISRNLGEKNTFEIKKTIINSLSIAFVSMIIMPAFIYIFRKPILYKLGASAATYALAEKYASIILLAGMFQCLGMIMCYIMTSFGNIKITLYVSSAGAIVNTILNYIFIVYYKIGIKGTAISTVISQIIFFALVLYKFSEVFKHFSIKLSIKSILSLLNMDIIYVIVTIGFSTFIVEISDAVVTVISNNLLYSAGGDTAIAVIGAVTKVSMFMFTVIIGISSAMQPIAAYNYGAGRFNKVKETTITSIKIVTITSLALAAIMSIFSNEILGFFIMDKKILILASRALKICISLLPLTGVYYILIYYYQAVGEAKKGFLLSIFRQIAVFIPLAIILVKHLGTLGVWIAYPASDLISALFSVYLLMRSSRYRKGTNITIKDKNISISKNTIFDYFHTIPYLIKYIKRTFQ